ncbi:MAG: HisA/HisF-related TIM barrel protein, partial [Dehalococcoidia bacterium]|nr:HisA/HisF-related TIM barrel protein [Dehalococcoidia bacterium]
MRLVRVIACLDVRKGKVVKGVAFENLREVDDPVEAAVAYCQQGVDELVFLDIFATLEGRATKLEWVRRVA